MKFKKISTIAAAIAAAAMMAMSASATNWATASYADDNPDTVSIISTAENEVVFTQAVDSTAAKCRVTLVNILENPDDVSKIKSGSWKITYKGLAGTDIQGVGGGTYCATSNSTSYWVSPTFNEDGTVTWEDEVVCEDSFKYLLPSHVPTDASTAEFVFMDWSNSALANNNVTITISDFKLFDENGNEIAQKAYAGEAAATEEAPAEEAPAAEEAAPATTEEAPASDNNVANASTGNASAAVIAGVMGVAAVAAVAAKKRK